MSQDIKNVLVAGASGNLGPFILEALSKDSQFTISVLSRKGSKATFPSHITVHQVSDAYAEDDLVPILKGQDAVISMIRPSMQEENKRLINASVRAGVKRFIPGEFGSNSASQAARDACPLFQKKLDLVNYLKSKEAEGLTWTSVICGAFFDWGLTTEFLGFSLPTQTATIFDTGDIPCRMTNLSTIGLAVARLLTPAHYTAGSNRYIYIASFNITQNEILASLEKATGKSWHKNHKSTSEARKEGLKKEKEGKGGEVLEGLELNLIACHFSEIEGFDYEDEELWNERLGLEKEDLDKVVKKVVDGEDGKS